MEGRKDVCFYFYFMRGEIITHASSANNDSFIFGAGKDKDPNLSQTLKPIS